MVLVGGLVAVGFKVGVRLGMDVEVRGITGVDVRVGIKVGILV